MFKLKRGSLFLKDQADKLGPAIPAGIQSNGNYSANTNQAVPFDPNMLYVGQVLWIGCRQHTVRPGDTVRSIAQEHQVDWQYVVESNTYMGLTAIPLAPEPLTIIEWP